MLLSAGIVGSGSGRGLAGVNVALAGFTEATAVSTVRAAIESLGYTVIMTPTYAAMAEDMTSETQPLTTAGRFRSDVFDATNELALTAGLPSPTLEGFPWIGIAGFANGAFYGSAAMIYTDYGAGTQLKNLWSPNQYRDLYTYVLNADGSERIDVAGTTRTVFSDNQSPGSNGYHSTSGFSSDDGSIGFIIGRSLDGNGGPYLSDSPADAYGCENDNKTDSGANTFYWGQAIETTNYQFYLFIEII